MAACLRGSSNSSIAREAKRCWLERLPIKPPPIDLPNRRTVHDACARVSQRKSGYTDALHASHELRFHSDLRDQRTSRSAEQPGQDHYDRLGGRPAVEATTGGGLR